MQEGRFYDQSQLWGGRPEPYQIQVRADVLDMLPPDVRSILDVGCGDGFITNALPGHLRVAGVDISAPALRHLRRPAVAGSIPALPFADRSFDLVMANDVLEHLPDEVYDRALQELIRVAGRYVLVTVPHGEQLETNIACCADCGERYHVNWHRRSYSADSMRALLPEPFHPLEIRLSGSETLPPPDPTVHLRQELGIFRVWAGGVCPKCGSKRQVEHDADSATLQAVDVLRSRRWYGQPAEETVWNNRTEIIGLYARDRQAGRMPPPVPVVCGRDSLLAVDFTNPLQMCRGDFAPGARWARWTLPAGAGIGPEGVHRSADACEPLCVHVRIPATGLAGDRIALELAAGGEGEVSLYGLDGLSGSESLLLTCRAEAGPSQAVAKLESPLHPDRFGLAFTLYLRGGVVVRRLEYLPADRPARESEFIALEAGHNVVAREHGGVLWSWGYLAASPGRYPMPRPAYELDSGTPCEVFATMAELSAVLDAQVAALRQSLSDLRGLLERCEQSRAAAEQAYATAQPALKAQMEFLHKELERQRIAHAETEKRRDAAERAYAAAERDRRNVQAKLEVVENELELARAAHAETEKRRDAAERAYAALQHEYNIAVHEWKTRTGFKGGLREILRTARNRTIGPPLPVPRPVFTDPWRPVQPPPPTGRRRILILSHMFPHPDQPASGPFIHEQVLALVRHGGLDVRVLVGRPFWMTTRHPVRLARLEQLYRRFHSNCGWVEYKGVLVKYLPYRVLGPFMTHGWAYRAAMCRGIERLYAEFPFELVHAHTAYTDGSAGLAIGRRFGVPLVITEHTGPFTVLTENPLVRFWTLRAMRGAARVLGVSRAQCRAVGHYLDERTSQRLAVMPNVVDVDLFRPPEHWSPDPAAPRILFVGFFVPIKRLEHLLEAFARLTAEIPGARLRLVGGGETPGQEEGLRGEVATRRLADRVEVLGYQPREVVAGMMRDWCDMLVLSSRAETFGCVLIEALACGKPVVSTRCGGPEDIVTADFLGRLADNEDPADLARAMADVARRLRDFDPARIRRYAVDTFSFQAVARRIASLYDEILNAS